MNFTHTDILKQVREVNVTLKRLEAALEEAVLVDTDTLIALGWQLFRYISECSDGYADEDIDINYLFAPSVEIPSVVLTKKYTHNQGPYITNEFEALLRTLKEGQEYYCFDYTI
jgi:hypothetical protein